MDIVVYNIPYCKNTLSNRLYRVNHIFMSDNVLSDYDDNNLRVPLSTNEFYILRATKAKENYNHLKYGIKNDILELCNSYSLANLQYNEFNNEKFKLEYEDLDFYFNQCFEDSGIYFPKLFNNYLRNHSKKIRRVQDKINLISDYVNDKYSAYFITLTLRKTYTAKNIRKEDYQEVRSKISRFLKNFAISYVCNKDFGIDDRFTKRLHFHGVILMRSTLKNSFKCKAYNKFGWCKIDEINNRSDLMSRYIQKLSIHALKVDYGYYRECLIYSREFPYDLFN